MERWGCNFKHELGSLRSFKDLPQLHEAVALQIHYYNTERIYSALGMSPAAYAALLNSGQLERDTVLQIAGP
jgi:transposase InsO family protein